MWIGFRILFFVVMTFVIALAFTMPLTLALNTLFFKATFLKALKATLIANGLIILLMIVGYRFIPAISQPVNYTMGAIGISFGASVFFWLLYGVAYLLKQTNLFEIPLVKFIFIGVLLCMSAIAIYNFEKPLTVEELTISSDKVSREHRFVLVGDTQLGTTSASHMTEVVELIAQQNPEFIVHVGDLIDGDYYKLQDFQAFDKVTVPTYFVRGNHEFYHDKDRVYDIIHTINSFDPLINEQATFGDIHITGVDYSQNKDDVVDKLNTMKIDTSQFNLLLYHDPAGFKKALDFEFDLMLAGHTHAGQIWPITMMMRWLYPYSYGYHQVGPTHLYTTSGAGLWGPKMRLGSQNEIVVVTITPQA